MTSILRRMVSKEKVRFSDNKFDLDLALINERIIAMGFPATGFATTYRNPAKEVAKFLNENYGGHYKVYNLTEHPYHESIFNGPVQNFPFPDHHAPPFNKLLEIVVSIHEWLEKDPSNVVAVHCLAGVGRTGTIISSALMYENCFDNAKSALEHFSQKRMNSDSSVNMPSQIRYVYYMERHIKYCVQHNLDKTVPPIPWKRTIVKVTITDPMNSKMYKPVLIVFDSSFDVIFNSAWIKEVRPISNATLVYNLKIPVNGDFTIKIYDSKGKNSMNELLRTTNNTAFIENNSFTYSNKELDGPHKGDKKYTPHFELTCEFEPISGLDVPIPLVYPNSEKSSLIPQATDADIPTS